jgi:four helix bundle protein
MSKGFDLEDRLIAFSIKIMEIAEKLPNTKSGIYISGQMIRSGTSPALNYAEAQSAESRNDFIHKMKICLKELRETLVSLKIIYRKPIIKELKMIEEIMNECIELISIFVKSIDTAKKNLIAKSKKGIE